MTDHLQHCQLSGKRLDSDDAIIQTGRGAYGVKANLLRELTNEKRAEIEARLFPSGEAVTGDSNNEPDSSINPDKPKSRNRGNLSGGDGG